MKNIWRVYMIFVRSSNIDEVILTFLVGEIDSDRFSTDLLVAMDKLGVDKELLLNPHLDSLVENELREKLLCEFRGYGKNDGLFENFPKVEECAVMLASREDLDKIKYMNYSYWNELSSGTSSCLVAAENIRNGLVVYDVSNEPFLKGVKMLENQKSFKPMILFTADYTNYVVLEGHSRLTIYGLKPECFENVECFVIKCSENDLKKWNGQI